MACVVIGIASGLVCPWIKCNIIGVFIEATQFCLSIRCGNLKDGSLMLIYYVYGPLTKAIACGGARPSLDL